MIKFWSCFITSELQDWYSPPTSLKSSYQRSITRCLFQYSQQRRMRAYSLQEWPTVRQNRVIFRPDTLFWHQDSDHIPWLHYSQVRSLNRQHLTQPDDTNLKPGIGSQKVGNSEQPRTSAMLVRRWTRNCWNGHHNENEDWRQIKVQAYKVDKGMELIEIIS